MKKLIIILLVLLVLDIAFAVYHLLLPKEFKEPKRAIIATEEKTDNIEDKIIQVSEKYLGVQYQANTLIGDKNTPEELVINKDKVDCFTFLDYVLSEALEKSVQDIRYKNSRISFETRNHYFTQWIENNQKSLFNLPTENCLEKTLNYVDGLVPVKQKVCWTEDFSQLENGDFVGFYSEKSGLDVSHVGIILIKNNRIYLRNASSKQDKVIDEKLEPRKLVIGRAFKELVEPKIKTDLQYIKYGSLNKCLLQKQVALMLEQAQEYLSDYKLVVYDCARPVSVQKKIWDSLEGKPEQNLFINPEKSISLHSYGAAVDLTIENLDMGSEFDSFNSKPLTPEQIANRNLLNSVMQKAGFAGIKSEWWHFEAFSIDVAKEKFDVVE